MHLFIWMMFVLHLKHTDSQLLTLCATSRTGSSCKLTCTTSDVSQTILFIKLPATGVQEGGCASGTCGATPGRTRYTVTQDAAKSETYLDISSLVYADDDSQWVCDYGALRSPTVNLTVISLPTTVHFNPAPTTADLSQLLIMEAFCVYPVSSLTPKLVYQDGQTNTSLDMTYPVSSTASPIGCDSHEFTVTGSFQLTRTTLSGKRVQFWIEATVAGQVIGSALTTQFFDFPGTTTPLTSTHGPPVCSCSWLPCGWKCHYLYIIIGVPGGGVIVVVIVVVGYRYRRGYCGKNKEEDRKKSYTNKAFDKNETENGQPIDSHRHTAL